LNVLLVQLGKRKTAAWISVYWVQLFVFSSYNKLHCEHLSGCHDIHIMKLICHSATFNRSLNFHTSGWSDDFFILIILQDEYIENCKFIFETESSSSLVNFVNCFMASRNIFLWTRCRYTKYNFPSF
jgi:hypothetical protein